MDEILRVASEVNCVLPEGGGCSKYCAISDVLRYSRSKLPFTQEVVKVRKQCARFEKVFWVFRYCETVSKGFLTL